MIKEVSSMERTILEILRAIGIYEEARRLVDSDAQLAELFERDFEELIRLAQN